MAIEDSRFAHLSCLLNHFCISERRVFVSIFYSCIAFSIIYPSLDVVLHHSISVDPDRTVFDWGSVLNLGSNFEPLNWTEGLVQLGSGS